ncbi:hypothetical protein EON65_30175 [archaeon]|nr:MAG: hypothetical protein EON65_30175 [archaeon]
MKLSNEHAMLLLHDRARSLFDDAMYYLSDLKPLVLHRIAHMSSVLVFSQGNSVEAKKYWPYMQSQNLVLLRSMSAQSLISGDDQEASALYRNMTTLLESSMEELLLSIVNRSLVVTSFSANTMDVEDAILGWLLSEAQGGVRLTFKLNTDLSFLSIPTLPRFDEKLRFRLGIGLTKLGLYDLSLRHVGLAATPWESPLYRLRAKLVFSPVHSSIGALAMAVNNFERQVETILLAPPPWGLHSICQSLNEGALALQALPLLHVVGLSSPIGKASLGHLPVPLPVVLSEVYARLCPPDNLLDDMKQYDHMRGVQNKMEFGRSKIRIGVVAGSLDGAAGKIMIGLLESLAGSKERIKGQIEFVSMCFPTARSAITDKLLNLFDSNVNLIPDNRTLSLERIRVKSLDLIVFADASSDARVFALAHERLARYQAVLWNWGGSLGIPSVDYYLLPVIFVREARCHSRHGDVLPQELFHEQVMLLEGLPSLPTTLRLVTEDLWQIMRSRYLLDLGNQTNIYFLPTSVKFLHPTFDRAIEVILQTDPIATVVLAVLRTGRDSLPTTHIAVRHDLLHPAMPPAAVAKFVSRLRRRLGNEVNRIRFMPPLDEPIFRALQMQAVAVLDPFPVGLHESILEAMLDGVPVVTAPMLQECTNSHAASIGRYLQIPAYSLRQEVDVDRFGDDADYTDIPLTAEDYGVLAVRLSKDIDLRRRFTLSSKVHLKNEPSHGTQVVSLISRLLSL